MAQEPPYTQEATETPWQPWDNSISQVRGQEEAELTPSAAVNQQGSLTPKSDFWLPRFVTPTAMRSSCGATTLGLCPPVLPSPLTPKFSSASPQSLRKLPILEDRDRGDRWTAGEVVQDPGVFAKARGEGAF